MYTPVHQQMHPRYPALEQRQASLPPPPTQRLVRENMVKEWGTSWEEVSNKTALKRGEATLCGGASVDLENC
jgi:hypothetical protein